MGNFLISTICLMQIWSCVESCSLPSSLDVIVPEIIPPGYKVAKVEPVGCDAKSMQLTVKDPSFTIKRNGAVVASTSVSVTERGRTLTVRARDNRGRESKMEVHLVRSTKPNRHQRGRGFLRRSKRRSYHNPTIVENYEGNYPLLIDWVVLDPSEYNWIYIIEGEGVDTYPTGVFSMDIDTGLLYLLKAVDREEFPEYNFVLLALDKYTLEEHWKIPRRVVVDDVNDNAPEFIGPLQFTVPEHCSAGTVVGAVSATDRDQDYTEHVKIKYTLLSGSDMFTIHPNTGVITTATDTLDRELKDNHEVTVKIQDMNGAPNGLFATSTATIALSDINDNPPTFMKTSYNVTVQENQSEKLLLRIPVQDKDLINTSNWISQFVITEGNENGHFRIVTDPQTNEGLLYIAMPLDYEKTNIIQLQITAQNQASLNGSKAKWQSIPVNVSVEKVDAGMDCHLALLNGSRAKWQSIPVNVSVDAIDAGSVSFGLLGIMTVLLPVVLLLLSLLLAFFCLTKREKLQHDESGGITLKSNTAAPGDSAKLMHMGTEQDGRYADDTIHS